MTASTMSAPVLSQNPLDGNQLRALFPGLTRTRQNPPTALFDNAGGSPLPACVIDAATEYLTHSYANTGGAYPESLNAAATIKRAHDVVGTFVNCGATGTVILGSSTTALVHLVANAYADALHAGSLRDSKRTEIIVSTAGHEANIGPWARIAERLSEKLSGRGVTLTLWPTERVDGPNGNATYRPRLSTLKKLISNRTLLVAMPHVSNILGEVWDGAEGVQAVCALAKQHGARTFIDGVAAAPHAAPDVQAIGCDWYVYSPYKVFGPHSGALFGTHNALAELVGPNHFFIPNDEVPRKWEVGGVSHEACAMICALPIFVQQVLGASGHANASNVSHAQYAAAFDHMAAIERTHQARIIDCLNRKPAVRIVGPATAGPERVATIAFTHATLKSSAIATKANALGLGIRSGHFYSKRLIDELATSHGPSHSPLHTIDPAEGIVRVSALCTNSTEDIDRLLTFFDATL